MDDRVEVKKEKDYISAIFLIAITKFLLKNKIENFQFISLL